MAVKDRFRFLTAFRNDMVEGYWDDMVEGHWDDMVEGLEGPVVGMVRWL